MQAFYPGGAYGVSDGRALSQELRIKILKSHSEARPRRIAVLRKYFCRYVAMPGCTATNSILFPGLAAFLGARE